MATRKPLVTASGTTQQIPDADTLAVGAGIDRATAGALAVGAATATAVVVTPDVGIGGAPTAKLDVTTGQVAIPDGTAAAPAIAFRDDLNNGIFSPATDIFGIAVNGAEVARFQQSAPGAPVLLLGTSSVYGSITVDSSSVGGTAGVVMLTHANAGTVIQESYRGAQLAGVRSRGTKAAPTQIGAGDGMANVLGTGWTNTGGINYGAMVTMKAEEAFTASASGGRIEFHTTTNGTDGFTTLGSTTTERMRITNAGRVGIGTSTPAERLEVSGSDARINGITVGRGGSSVSTNTALGANALVSNAAGGINNVAAGLNALSVNTTGDQNVAVGASALSSSVTVSNQTAVGYAALNQATGGGNTALGASAGNGVTSGTFNVAVGESALSLGATASNAVAVGAGALAKNTANANVAVGADAGIANTTGVRLTAVGHTAASTSQTANDVTAVGYEALLNNGNSGSSNTAVGSRALLTATTGNSCTAVGHEALRGASTDVPTGSTAVGASALGAITTGQRNTAMGFFAGGLLSSAANNSYFGYLAGQKITGGSNTGLGYAALGNSTGGAGESNTAVGSQSLGTLQSGFENVAVGREAAFALTSGGQNVAVGAYALSSATTNGSNVAVGFNAMLLDTLGTDSVAIGFRALDAQNPAAASAMNNVGVGSGAGGAVTTGTNNTLIGTGAGDLLTTGANNVIIGSGADPAANSNTNTVVIGRNAVATGSNNVTFGNATTDTFRFGVATTALPNPGFSGQGLAGTAPSVAVGHTSATTASNFMVFAGGGGARGLISGNGAGGVNFTSLSDYRVKSEIEDIADPLARLSALHPCSFRMTGVAADAPRVEGFIAHEVQAIVPEAVAGTKDAVDAEGNPVHQGLDQSRLVPLLTAACQALVARAEAAEARLAALEAAVAALQAG